MTCTIATACSADCPTALWVLYSLYEDEEKTYTQNDFVSMWFYPKQTVNYTVSGLVKKGWITLEQMPAARNSKTILLTEEGRHICEEKSAADDGREEFAETND